MAGLRAALLGVILMLGCAAAWAAVDDLRARELPDPGAAAHDARRHAEWLRLRKAHHHRARTSFSFECLGRDGTALLLGRDGAPLRDHRHSGPIILTLPRACR